MDFNFLISPQCKKLYTKHLKGLLKPYQKYNRRLNTENITVPGEEDLSHHVLTHTMEVSPFNPLAPPKALFIDSFFALQW